MLENAFNRTLSDHGLDFFIGDGGLVGGPNPKDPQNHIAGQGDEPHNRGAEPCQKLHGRGDAHGHGLGMAQTDALGRQLTQYQRKESDNSDHQDKRECIGVGRENRSCAEALRQPQSQRGPAECTGQDSHKSDADLHRRQEGAGILCQCQCARGAPASHHRLFLQAGSPGRDDGDLGHRKHAVQSDQGEDE